MTSTPVPSPPPTTAINKHVSRDEILFDRQVRLWGQHGQRQLRHTNILALGSSTTITEALKGLILPTIQSFTIVDPNTVNEYNVSNNFFLTQHDQMKKRPISEALVESLEELNPKCKGIAVREHIGDYLLKVCFNTLQLYHILKIRNTNTSIDVEAEIINDNATNQFLSHLSQTCPSTSISQLYDSLSSQTTATLLDFTIVLIDPFRVPITILNIFSVFCTFFSVPLLTVGSYSTFSMVKLAYPMRCTIETHYSTNPSNNNLYLNQFQLSRFSTLQQYITQNYSKNSQLYLISLSKPDIDPKNSIKHTGAEISNFLDTIAKRGKIPYPIVLYTCTMLYCEQNGKKLLEITQKNDLLALKEFVRSKRWQMEDNFIEAEAHVRDIFNIVRIQQPVHEVLNHPHIIGTDDKKITIMVQNLEKFYTYSLSSQFTQPAENVSYDLNNYINFDALYDELMIFYSGIGFPTEFPHFLPPISRKYFTGDRNHPFWLLSAALRLFVLNYPISHCVQELITSAEMVNEVYPLLDVLLSPHSSHKSCSHPEVNHKQYIEHIIAVQTQNTSKIAQIAQIAEIADNSIITHGCLPISHHNIPDMHSSTELYSTLKTLYKDQFLMDYTMFVIYLHCVLKFYTTTSKKHPFTSILQNMKNSNRTEIDGDENFLVSYTSLQALHERLHQELHVEHPILYFLQHCRELKVNTSTSTFSFMSSSFESLRRAHNAFHCKKPYEIGFNGNEQLTTLLQLLSPQFIAEQSLMYGFTNMLTPTPFQQFVSTSQLITETYLRQKSLQQQIFQEGANNQYKMSYLLNYYISVLSLMSFQYYFHRFPLMVTGITKFTLSDVGIFNGYSFSSDELSHLLHLAPMALSHDDKVNNESQEQNVANITKPFDDITKLLGYHAHIYKQFTKDIIFYDWNGDEHSALSEKDNGLQLDTTRQLFTHQFTELPTTASITGSIAADLMLKLALKQYAVVETSVLYDSQHSRGGSIYL